MIIDEPQPQPLNVATTAALAALAAAANVQGSSPRSTVDTLSTSNLPSTEELREATRARQQRQQQRIERQNQEREAHRSRSRSPLNETIFVSLEGQVTGHSVSASATITRRVQPSRSSKQQAVVPDVRPRRINHNLAIAHPTLDNVRCNACNKIIPASLLNTTHWCHVCRGFFHKQKKCWPELRGTCYVCQNTPESKEIWVAAKEQKYGAGEGDRAMDPAENDVLKQVGLI